MTIGSTREGGVGTVAIGVDFTGSTGTSTVGALACVPAQDVDAAARPAKRPRTAARTSGDGDGDDTPRGYQKPGSSMTRGSPVEGAVGDVEGAVVGAVVGDVLGEVGSVDGDVVVGDVEGDVSSAFGALGVAGVLVPAHGCAGRSSLVDGVDAVDFAFGGIAGPDPR